MNTTGNKTYTAEEITASVKNAVQNYNNSGDKNAFFTAILNAVKCVGVETFTKATKLSRVEIYDALDGVSPSSEHLSCILAVFGVKMTFAFNENDSQIKNLLK